MTTNPAHTFVAEPARAVPMTLALAPVTGERRIDNAPALAGRFAT